MKPLFSRISRLPVAAALLVSALCYLPSCSGGGDDDAAPEPAPGQPGTTLDLQPTITVKSPALNATDLKAVTDTAFSGANRFLTYAFNGRTMKMLALQSGRVVDLGEQPISGFAVMNTIATVKCNATGLLDPSHPFLFIGTPADCRVEQSDVLIPVHLRRNGTTSLWFSVVGGQSNLEVNARMASTAEMLFVRNVSLGHICIQSHILLPLHQRPLPRMSALHFFSFFLLSVRIIFVSLLPKR